MPAPVAANGPPPQTQTPPPAPAPGASTSAIPGPGRIGNRPLHVQSMSAPAASNAGPGSGVAEARDAHYTNLIRATAMRPMVAEVTSPCPLRRVVWWPSANG